MRSDLQATLSELAARVRRATLDLRLAKLRAPSWSLPELVGRLTELSGTRSGSGLSLVLALVRDAQLRGESAAWVGGRGSSFFPPDAAEAGVDLAALTVVRVPH